MTCEGCDESRAAGYAFCKYCGEPLDSCPDCDTYREEGRRYCPTCGRPLREPKGRDTLSRICLIAVPLVAVLLIAELVIMVLGIPTVLTASDLGLNLYILIPHLDTLTTLTGLGVQLCWVLLLVVILRSAAILIKQSLPALRTPAPFREEAVLESPFYNVAAILCVDILLSLVLSILLLNYGAGATAGTTVGFNAESLLVYANAAFWEEMITRVVYIGVPMLVLALCYRRRDALRYLVGGFGMSKAALVLIVISAVIFGFAHESGWGTWKVLPTFVGGLLLGYVYVRYGLHASIIMHFLVDYMATMSEGWTSLIVSLIMILLIVIAIPVLMRAFSRIRSVPAEVRGMPNIIPPDQESIFRRRD